MSGHSKWSTIKHKKGATDAKRGKIFTRLAREIALAARESGGDPVINFQLRLAIERARAQNMPKDNIERSIKRGTGEGKDAEALEEVTYEGYASHGVALMIECVTENRNRTVAEVRHVLNRMGGSMGESGSVMWQFTRSTYFAIPAEGVDFDEVFELAVEGGADDITEDAETIEISGATGSFKTLSDSLHAANIIPDEAGLRMIPKQEISLGTSDTLKVLRTIEDLEDLDDVQNVYSNLHISEEALIVLESA